MAVPYVMVAAGGTLGGAAGRTFNFGNWGPGLLACIRVLWTTTATAGNRVPGLGIKDANGNFLWESSNASQLSVSTPYHVSWGAGIQGATGANGGGYLTAPLADNMLLPPGCQFVVLDVANIDPNDTVAANALMSI